MKSGITKKFLQQSEKNYALRHLLMYLIMILLSTITFQEDLKADLAINFLYPGKNFVI